MNDRPEPPTVIVPTKCCWKWYANQPHRAHEIDVPDPPYLYRCPGIEQQETPCPSSESTSPGTTPTR